MKTRRAEGYNTKNLKKSAIFECFDIFEKKNSYYLKWGWGEIKNFVNDENPQN